MSKHARVERLPQSADGYVGSVRRNVVFLRRRIATGVGAAVRFPFSGATAMMGQHGNAGRHSGVNRTIYFDIFERTHHGLAQPARCTVGATADARATARYALERVAPRCHAIRSRCAGWHARGDCCSGGESSEWQERQEPLIAVAAGEPCTTACKACPRHAPAGFPMGPRRCGTGAGPGNDHLDIAQDRPFRRREVHHFVNHL